MADGTYNTHTGTGNGTGRGIADPAKATKGKAKAKTKAEARAKKELTEAERVAAAATYGGERAFAELSPARRRDLLVDAWLLMHPTIEERAEREKRQRAAGVDPASVPAEATLKNYWRDRREKASRQRKILAFGYAITAAALAGEAAEAAEAARSRPRPVLAELRAPVFAKRERNIGDAT